MSSSSSTVRAHCAVPTSPTIPLKMSRCVNCSLSMVHPLPRRQVGEATDVMVRILRSWVTPATSEIPSSRNEIKVFCPKCNTEVSHTAEGIQEDQTKILVAKVYHYFEKEYEDLKKIYGDLDLTPLSNFRQRTALATGVSETTLLQILQEEEERNADKRREPPKKRRAARKRRRQTDCSREEGSSDDNVDDIEQPRHADETLTVVVKIEPPIHNNDEPEKSEIILPAEMKLEHSDGEIDNDEPEIFIPPLKMESSDGDTDKEQTDPISLDVKTEPRDDEMDTTNETLALNEPATTKRKGRKISRNSDDKSIQSSLSGDRRNT